MSLQEWYEEGMQNFKAGNWSKAIESFDKGLKAQGDHHPCLYGMAITYFKMEKFGQSITFFNKLIALDPGNAHYISERGVTFHLSGDNQAALQDMNRAQELEPQNPYRYSSRAYIKSKMGDYQGAIEDYEHTIYLDPEDKIAYNNLGLIQENLGYAQKAKSNFSRADQLEGKGDYSQSSSGLHKKTSQNTNGNGAYTSPKAPQAEKQQAGKIPAGFALKTFKEVFTTRKGFREFLQFWATRLKGK